MGHWSPGGDERALSTIFRSVPSPHLQNSSFEAVRLTHNLKVCPGSKGSIEKVYAVSPAASGRGSLGVDLTFPTSSLLHQPGASRIQTRSRIRPI